MGVAIILSIVLAVYHFCCMAKTPNYFSSYKHHLLHVIATGLYLFHAIDYLVQWVLLYSEPHYASDLFLSGYRRRLFATTFVMGLHVLGWCLLAGKALGALINVAWPEKVKVDGSIGKQRQKKNETYSYGFTDGSNQVRFHFHGGLPQVR